MAAESPRPSEMATLQLAPGDYDVSVLGRRLCTAKVIVSGAPLQRVVIHC